MLKSSLPSPAAAVVFCACALVFLLDSAPACAQRMMPFSFWQEAGFAPRGTEPVRVDVPRDTIIHPGDGSESASVSGHFGVDIIGTSASPRAFEARQPHPNPFGSSSPSGTGTTTIQIRMTDAATLTVRLYSILGQPLSTLFDAELPAGPHSLRIQPPTALPGGTYFVGIASEATAVLLRIVYLP
ncbi:MAG: hypothetical protein IPP94_02445 [Ignavibacteria bacterium]|nr:hypothetical protein [Ignavibacteria bacterium]